MMKRILSQFLRCRRKVNRNKLRLLPIPQDVRYRVCSKFNDIKLSKFVEFSQVVFAIFERFC